MKFHLGADRACAKGRVEIQPYYFLNIGSRLGWVLDATPW